MWYFWFQNSFLFFVALTKKKVRTVRSFSPQNQSKLANQTGQNHCGLYTVKMDYVQMHVCEPSIWTKIKSTLLNRNFGPSVQRNFGRPNYAIWTKEPIWWGGSVGNRPSLCLLHNYAKSTNLQSSHCIDTTFELIVQF